MKNKKFIICLSLGIVLLIVLFYTTFNNSYKIENEFLYDRIEVEKEFILA